jgi:hypothetical protein
VTVKRLVLILVVAYCGYAAYLTDPAYQRLNGDIAEPVLQRFHGADFGGFYTGATAAARGELHDFTDPDFQRALQTRSRPRSRPAGPGSTRCRTRRSSA